MNKAILNRNLRKLHLWFGIGIGLQLGFWLISGLFMTLFPIDQVRGTHLRSEQTPPLLEPGLNILGPFGIMAISTPLFILFAGLSWHVIEKPALKLKSRAT